MATYKVVWWITVGGYDYIEAESDEQAMSIVNAKCDEDSELPPEVTHREWEVIEVEELP